MESHAMKRMCCIGIFLLGGLPAPFTAHGASPPDAGAILREIKDPPAIPERAPDSIIETSPETSGPEVAGPKIFVKGFRITGATLFAEETLAALLQEESGKNLSFSELQKAAEKITAYYTVRGYLARAYLPPQEIKDNIVEIAVIEGRLEEVIPGPESESPLDFQLAKQYITASQGIGEPVRMDRIERGMLLLNDLPGMTASSTLQPGTQEGMVQHAITLAPTPFLSGSIDLDNTGNRAPGEYRARARLDLNNPGGIGDRIAITALGAFEDSLNPNTRYGKIAYSLPVGYSGLHLGASFAALDYTLGANFEAAEAEGRSTIYSVFASYPLIRQRQHNLIITATYDHKQFHDQASRVTTSNKRINAATLGVNGNIFDSFLDGGLTYLGINLVMGRLDLGRWQPDLDTDQASARTNGEYKKVTLNLYRLQRLAEKTSLSLSLTHQRAFNNLDSSEDFSLGGAFGVRAYPANEAAGDEGTLFTVELQHKLTQDITLFGFYDHGRITTNHKEWTTTIIPNSYSLEGIGCGIAYIKAGDFSIKAAMAGRLGNNPGRDPSGNDSDGAKREPRIWVLASKYF